MNKNGLNLGQVVFSAVKVVLMVLFLIFEGVPTFIDRLSDGRSIIFAIIELVGSTASIYVVVTILVMVFLMTCSLLGTFIAFVLLVFLMSLCTATVAAMFNMKCEIFMGEEDVKRQAPNVRKMRLLGAKVNSVKIGSKTLKDAVNEAIRDWVTNVDNTFYVLGSALGPHPYPTMVRDFQRIIGDEARNQILEVEGRLPDYIVAAVGGGSNSIGVFYPFINDKEVKLIGVEAGGLGLHTQFHAARFAVGKKGILQGMKSYVISDDDGNIAPVHSISAGLDYPGVGPEHAYLNDIKRAQYTAITDDEAVNAFYKLTRIEGIIPALESSHAVAYAMKIAPTLSKDSIILVNLSGRGDKDMDIIESYENKEGAINE